mmetsp:Transcript_607/g.949  ORF Transcript_607/g.949 Transcript_607/m.949 type:complete len:969 (+) Transcript_607:69-2975(+)|eukprot:CAMPEP_0194222190 /NCGR_PEP_ID=MMETSP0156-20130528/32352_1 /TAXON_ID=33649 /ORGANISM="Thalassionema nitzschioides, Strain L26-B" /LENGTH=968 /DNA_ID=CAMNT_0038952879 /DNA_START=60 /DNA_END=2966 /DNA_ORIENTATION=+
MIETVDPTVDQPSSILLGGEDTVEEDEAMPIAPPAETNVETSDELISKIITPSPYPHHISGPTSSRFRNALNRINADPFDVEAWQALMTETNTCWRSILPVLHNGDADTHNKLDWMESCFGHLLHYFPYAASYWKTVIEMLLAQSARVGEEGGPFMDYAPSKRSRQSEAKVERIFREILGIEIDGTLVEGMKLGGMCTSSVEIWLLYIRKRVRDANRLAIAQADEKMKSVREITIKAYESAIEYTSFAHNNHIIWKHYLDYVKGWIPNPALNQDHALTQQQMVQLRSIYQRLVTHPMLGLDQLWQEYELFERGQNEALAAALINEFAPKKQHARNVYLDRNKVFAAADLQMNRLAAPPANIDDEDYASKMLDEHNLLTLWKKRCAYERFNPERVTPDELLHRTRQAYKDFACAFTRHPEVWHMWSSWELLQASSKNAEKADYATSVLELAQTLIPDCTLLCYARAQVVELQTPQPQDCLKVMEVFLERCPNTLGFVLYQQMVRRYKGVEAARAVFAKARRVLKEGSLHDETKLSDVATEDIKKEDMDESGAATATLTNGKRRMVTNRLDPNIATTAKATTVSQENGNHTPLKEDSEKLPPGPITWQLYVSHATMEHRINHSPSIAARVYELGLRKHVEFLTKPPYIKRYAQLLLELQDTENLRALLTRAVTACEGDGSNTEAAASLWDMTLRFESILSGGDPRNVSELKNVERRRHAALFGAEIEDVSTGGLLGSADIVQIGGQKTSLSEQLVRAEGYDASSSIVNGMGRMVDVLEVMGLWGNDSGSAGRRRKQQLSQYDEEWGQNDEELSAGGKSDASYQRRLNFQKMLEAKASAEKKNSARERLQASAAVSQSGQPNAVALAIQQSPEWLRPLLLLLPASRMRMAILGKPSHQMVELALSTLRASALPAERPAGGTIPRKRQREGDDSDDSDDDAIASSGGYGSQFRARQKARQEAAPNQQTGATQ